MDNNYLDTRNYLQAKVPHISLTVIIIIVIIVHNITKIIRSEVYILALLFYRSCANMNVPNYVHIATQYTMNKKKYKK